MKKKVLGIGLAMLGALSLVGCASDGDNYVFHAKTTEVCIVDNPDVRAQVFLEIRRALMDKGYDVRRLEYGDLAGVKTCHQTIYYEATFGSSWIDSSLRHAKLELIERARHNNIFTVQWDERSRRPTLFDPVEEASVEIRQLVDRLFPEDIPWK